MFSISYSNQAHKFLKKGEKILIIRLLEKIERLKTEQVPHDSKVLEGSNKVFRVRVGNYRILYEIYYEESLKKK